MKNLIKDLSDLRGISGFEYRLTDEIKKKISPYCDEIHTDTLGNIIAIKKSEKSNAKKIMIEAHIDEIGLMVSDIDENGFIKFVNIGGVDPRILPSSQVIIHGKKDIDGVIGAKPPHLQTEEESKTSIEIKDMSIDTGYDGEDIKKIVSIGDSITLSQSSGELLGTRFSGKTLDDRAGVAAIITVLKNIQNFNLPVDVYVVAAVQEEVGCRGAKTATYLINPDIAIAIDVCHGITPDNSDNAFEIGSGAVVSVGPNLHPKLTKRIIDTADRYNIKTQIDVDGGNTGTDAWVMQVTRCGIPTALLSIPLKYMHTSVETIDVMDVTAVSDLLTFFIQNFDDNLEEWLCF